MKETIMKEAVKKMIMNETITKEPVARIGALLLGILLPALCLATIGAVGAAGTSGAAEVVGATGTSGVTGAVGAPGTSNATGALGAARATDRDPVWDRAVATIVLAARTVASRIETHTEILNGKGKRMETHDRIQTLTGWNGQEPVRKSEEKHDVVQKSGMTASIDLGATDNPFFASTEGRVSYARAGEEVLDDHPCIRFRFEENPPPPTKGDDEIGTLVGSAWVDRDTGVPLKMVYHPKELPKHVSVYDLTVRFATRPDGSSVPRELDMQMKAGFLWYQRVVRLHKTFSDWVMPTGAMADDPSPDAIPADTP
jgi:hypothetical protein